MVAAKIRGTPSHHFGHARPKTLALGDPGIGGRAPRDRLPDGRGDGAARAVWADAQSRRRVAPNAAASPMFSVADVTRLAGRRHERCVRISTDRARFTLRRRPSTGQTRRKYHPDVVTVARAAGLPIGSPVDGQIRWSSGECRLNPAAKLSDQLDDGCRRCGNGGSALSDILGPAS